MHDLSVLMTFAGGLACALVFGFLAHRLKLSPIVGYLLAGVAVGPFTPGFVADHAVAEQFAEIGVILLLFGIGLRFHLRELIAVWRVAVPGALIQSTLSTVALALALRLLGWSWISGIILGMAISVASTVVMALVLGERHDLHATIGHIAIGWTVVEDLLTVAVLLLLPIVFAPEGGGSQSAAAALGLAALKVVGLVAVVVLLGRWVIPWALERIEKTRSRELFTLAVLVLAVGIAVGSATVFGVSMALGAFLAGLAVGRSEFAARAAGDAVPMRDAFAVLFFVSVGMLFDPRSLVQVAAADRGGAGSGGDRQAARRPADRASPRHAPGDGHPGRRRPSPRWASSASSSAAVARGLGLIDDAGWNALVAASIISIALNPSIYRWARRVSSTAAELAPVRRRRPARDRSQAAASWSATVRSAGSCTGSSRIVVPRSRWSTSTSTRCAACAPRVSRRSTATCCAQEPSTRPASRRRAA